MNSSYFKTMMAGISGMFADAIGDRSKEFKPHKNSDQVRRSLSPTKKYKSSGGKKIHNTIGSRFRSAVQIREKAVGVHWLKA